jgi:GNAT superfamily N-acetyltransferase
MSSTTSRYSSEKITVSSYTDTDEDGITSIRVYVPHSQDDGEDFPQAYYGGEANYDEPNVLVPSPLYVEPAYRGRGIGEALVRRLVEEAKREKIDTIRGHIESQFALDIRARIFGKESMKFFLDEEEAVAVRYHLELPITFDQARASLVRVESYEKSLEDREIGFDVEQNISSIDPKSREWSHQ